MKGLLSKIEYIVIGIFTIIFLMWAVSKCSSHKEKAREQAAVEAKEDSIVTAQQKPATPANSTVSKVNPTTQNTSSADTTQAKNTSLSTKTDQVTQSVKPQESQGTRLYVTIDKLKIRKTPGLKGELLGELKLFDEVYYQNEVTDSTYEVNLGKELANEPYVKVKTKRGTIGWVYGAGVHYIKKKRSGVLE